MIDSWIPAFAGMTLISPAVTMLMIGPGLLFLLALTLGCLIAQILSASVMARQLKFSWLEFTVGIGMGGRAEMAFILASLGLSEGILTNEIFSILIATTFLLNLLTACGLKGCAFFLARQTKVT